MPTTQTFSSLEAVQAIFDALPVPAFIKDRRHCYRLANTAFAELLGQSVGDVLGRPDTDFVTPEHAAMLRAMDDEVFDTGALSEKEGPVTNHAGQTNIALTRKQLAHLRTADGGLEPVIVGVISDVTPFRKAEARARRAETLHAAEARIMDVMSNGTPLPLVLQTVCAVVDEVSGAAMSSIHLFDAQKGVLTQGASATLPQAYVDALDPVPVVDGAGSCGTAAYRREQVIVADIATDPLWEGYRDLAEEHGLRACWSTPIFNADEELLGAFALYYPEPREPRGDDLMLIARVTQLVAIAIERATRDEKLRASEERFQQLAGNTDDVFWMTNSRGEAIYLSPAFETVWGRKPEALYADPKLWMQAVHPDDRPALIAAISAKDAVFKAYYRVIRPDGTIRWISDRGFPVRNDAGEIIRLTGVARDVTEMKVAEQALVARSEEARAEASRRQAIFDSARDAIVTLDPQGRIETMNVTAERMFGYATGELLGQELCALLTFQAPSAVGLTERLRSGRALGDGDVYELEARRKDGSVLQVDVNVGEMQQPDGVHFVAVLRDSTERKRIEKTKEEFISTVSHELRTPLTSIAGALGLLTGGAGGELPDRAARLVNIAESNSRRLVRLINDILDIEKMQSGQMTFSFRKVDLGDVSRGAIDGMNGLAAELGVSFEHRAGEAVPVQADPDRLTQVFSNLLSNAAKFSRPGGRITVTTAAVGARARVSVQDEGSGIPEEFHDRIFSKFAQADASDTRAKGGTGLGLAISKEIVERHGGRIWFDSPAGQGATFHVELPLAAPVEVSAEADGARRLLLVEDDPDVSEVLTRVLAMQGFGVDVAATLEEANAALHVPCTYDGMLLDLRLPDGSGLDLLRKMRADPATCTLPVIVISADAMGSGASTLDIVDWIEKPVDFKRLQRCLEKFLDAGDEPPLVLHVDDDPDLRQLVCEAFGGRGRLLAADSVQGARDLLTTVIPDIAILDIGLPDGSGLDLLPNLVDANGQALPVVIFSAQNLEHSTLTDAVDAVLTKSRTSLDQLIRTVNRLSASQGEGIKAHHASA